MYSIHEPHIPEVTRSSEGYTVEGNQVQKTEWDSIVKSFRDGGISQVQAWGKIKYGEKQISHLVLKRGSTIAAAAQVRILRIPLLRMGLASVMRGPMWKPINGREDLSDFRTITRYLKREYAEKRGLCLRVAPNWTCQADEKVASVLLEEGFQLCRYRQRYRTLILDLSPSIGELRNGLRRQWHQQLDKATKNGLNVIEGDTDELFATFARLYKEMFSRRRFTNRPDIIDDYRAIQRDLNQSLKMKIRICEFQGEPVAGLVVSHIGEVATVLFAATSRLGLELRASFLLWWRTIEAFKEAGALRFDLHGIDLEKNPGGYQFKSGLAGKWAKDIHLEEFVYCVNPFVGSLDMHLNLGRNLFRRTRGKTIEFARKAGTHLPIYR